MTLLLDYTTSSGISLVQAYVEIYNISWDKRDGLEVKFKFNIYKDKESFDLSFESIVSDQYSFIYNMTSGIDIVTQCYTYMKSLDRFTNIVDLLDGY
jgi:hypothetical protein